MRVSLSSEKSVNRDDFEKQAEIVSKKNAKDHFYGTVYSSELPYDDDLFMGSTNLKSRAALFGTASSAETLESVEEELEAEPEFSEILVDVAPGIKAKSEVNLDDVVPQLKAKLLVIFEAYKKFGWADLGANPLVITSGKDSFSYHKKNSLHKKGKALDLRGKHIPNADLSKIAAEIQRKLGSKYQAWAEFWKDPNRDHIHVEYRG